MEIELCNRTNDIRLRAVNGMDVKYVGMVKMSITLWGRKIMNVGMLTTNYDNVCLIGMNVLNKFEYVRMG